MEYAIFAYKQACHIFERINGKNASNGETLMAAAIMLAGAAIAQAIEANRGR